MLKKNKNSIFLLLLYFLSMEVEPVETSVFHVFFLVSEPVEDTENTETERKKQIFFLKKQILY